MHKFSDAVRCASDVGVWTSRRPARRRRVGHVVRRVSCVVHCLSSSLPEQVKWDLSFRYSVLISLFISIMGNVVVWALWRRLAKTTQRPVKKGHPEIRDTLTAYQT